jgi:hypothetical protein
MFSFRNPCIGTAVIAGVVAPGGGSMSGAMDPVSNGNAVAVQATVTAGENAIVQSRTLAIAQVAATMR